MATSSSRDPIPGRPMEGVPATDDAAAAGSCGISDAESSSSVSSDGGRSEGSDLESMTGKGIKCLCSELLELKKSSDEDFQRNLYSNYPTFVRVLKKVGDIELELMELKSYVSDQKNLVNNLMSFFSDNFSEDLLELTIENDLGVDDYFISDLQTHSISILEKLDVLSSEQLFEEILVILETENKTLQKINMEGDQISAESFSSYKSALSEWRTRLVDQLASMAGHPRVTAAELQILLSLLCRINEDSLANSLLIKFHHLHIVNHIHDFQGSKPLLNPIYIMEVAKIVFSVISQAARSFVMLYGETSPYSSEFMVWVTEEVKMFTHYFDMYVKSISEMNRGLLLAIEGMKCAISFCSLLKPQSLVLLPYLIKLVRPCMEEALEMHVNYLRKNIRMFTLTDTWILGKFLRLEITGEKSSVVGDECKLEYCLLTNSGRKFMTLIQVILEDISPLSSLQMENSILRGLTDLFVDYIKILERAIPSFGNYVEKGSPRISSAQMLSQQLAILVNSSTLVDYFSLIVQCIFEGVNSCNDEQVSENYVLSGKREFDSWILSVQDAADQLSGFFCQQFVNRYISATAWDARTGLESYMKSVVLGAASSQFLMPSSEFQMLFQQLQQLKRFAKSNFVGANKAVEKLLKDLMDSIVVMTSNNTMFWGENEDSSPTQRSIWFKQFVLDMHFLVEIAKFGGFFSDRLMEASRSLMVHVEKTFSVTESDTYGAMADDMWAIGAAKAAIQKLMEMGAIKLEPDEKHRGAVGEDYDHESAQSSREHDVIRSEEFSDGEIESFVERDVVETQKIENSGVSSFDGIANDFKARLSHDRDFISPPTGYVDLEDMEDALRTGMEVEATLEEDTTCRQNEYAAHRNESVIDVPRDMSDEEFADNENYKSYSVQSMLTQGLATNNIAYNEIEHCAAKLAVDENSGNPVCTRYEQGFTENETMAVAHSTCFPNYLASSEPLDDNCGNQATEMPGSPSEHSIEDGMFTLDEMATGLSTNLEELQYTQPFSAVRWKMGKLSESDTRSELSTSQGIDSPPEPAQDVPRTGEGTKHAPSNSSPRKLKAGRGCAKNVKAGRTTGNITRDSPRNSGTDRKGPPNSPQERSRWQ